MLVKELIDRLERLALLDPEIIDALRDQLQQSGSRATPEAVAKLLVDNGQLTRFQATKLIGDLRSNQYAEDEPAPVAEPIDDLTFSDEDADPVAQAEMAQATPILVAEPIAAAEPIGVATADFVDAGLPGPPRRRRTAPEKSVWDSFKVYGYVGIIALLAIFGGTLYWILSRENADDVIGQANKLYDQQNYQPAQDAYIAYLSSFGESTQHSSLAKTRVTMTELYRAENLPDPVMGLEVARRELPKIVDEPALNNDRDDLAGLLVDIAENLASAADRSESSAEKQTLVDRLDEQLELMTNPQYMSSTMRVTLSGQLKAIEEQRGRVLREIKRNDELARIVGEMNTVLQRNDTKAAYDLRFDLLRNFPELRDNGQLAELITKASGIQQTLVKPSTRLPQTSTEAIASDTLNAIVLSSLSGGTVPGMREEIVFVRAGGSVLAFAGDTGKVLWRKYVGTTQVQPPVRVDGGQGVLLCNGDRNEVALYRGADGQLIWRAMIEEPFGTPLAYGDEIYVSTRSGRLIALDATDGSSRWVTQIPQGLEVGPGVDPRAKKAYLPGDHSNLYVVDTREGKCGESYYIGHAPGTISVPPVALLGHLFVIENPLPDTARVHVLKFDKAGEKLELAQPPFLLSGNVRVPPIVQQRRLVVLTDLGQVTLLDVEPTAARDKVSAIARCSPSYKRPTATQMAASRSQMWITGTRVARFELQVNTGQVARDWVQHEGDLFVGEPIATDDALIHARVLRGTSGVRVTAAVPATGEEIWRTDVGVPVSMIAQVPAERAFHAITSQGALFRIDPAAISSGSTSGPVENPGGSGVAMQFEQPLATDENSRVLVNRQESSEILSYEPARPSDQLRKVTLQLPVGSRLAGRPAIAGGGLFMPLDTGRAVVMRWQTGGMLGSPFQPPSDPNVPVTWSDPVAVQGDADQIVIADSRKKLYRLRVGEQIRELSSVDLEAPLLGNATRIGSTLVATIGGPSADSIVGFDLATLESRFQVLLQNRVQWGPSSIGGVDDVCLIRTADGLLRVIDAQGQTVRDIELPAGDIVGQPIAYRDGWLITGRPGWIRVIDPASGESLHAADLNQPISAAPLPVGTGTLLVPGHEGVIYVVQW